MNCPDCQHEIAGHTARVGEEGRVCYLCDCYRYSGDRAFLGKDLLAEWQAAMQARLSA